MASNSNSNSSPSDRSEPSDWSPGIEFEFEFEFDPDFMLPPDPHPQSPLMNNTRRTHRELQAGSGFTGVPRPWPHGNERSSPGSTHFRANVAAVVQMKLSGYSCKIFCRREAFRFPNTSRPAARRRGGAAATRPPQSPMLPRLEGPSLEAIIPSLRGPASSARRCIVRQHFGHSIPPPPLTENDILVPP